MPSIRRRRWSPARVPVRGAVSRFPILVPHGTIMADVVLHGTRRWPVSDDPTHLHVAIIGAGDVPSHLYSFSFAPNPSWSRSFSTQPEIWAYLHDCARRFGLLPHLRLGHEVLQASWDDGRQHWQVETSGGAWTADVLIAATGPLSEPQVPALPGLDSFQGTVFHSARWDHDHDLTGRQVAVVGTGASAIQFVPEIQPRVGRLSVFQRTAPWLLPRRDRALTGAERWLFRTVPATQRLARSSIYWVREGFTAGFLHPRIMRLPQRLALRHLRRADGDPVLRAQLTPDYTFGC